MPARLQQVPPVESFHGPIFRARATDRAATPMVAQPAAHSKKNFRQSFDAEI